VMLCCSPNDVAAHLLTLATLPTPLWEPISCNKATRTNAYSYTSIGFLAFNESGMCACYLLTTVTSFTFLPLTATFSHSYHGKCIWLGLRKQLLPRNFPLLLQHDWWPLNKELARTQTI
jgi:hypothetical protein